ncbi:MAG: beta-galactosidase [Anaerolineae bacterium]|nr:beta-galactosidase [Anaerolineae bacterium]
MNWVKWLVYGLRVIILGGLLSLIAPIGVRVTLPPPQMVETEQPQVCVHTRLIDEVQEWVIQKSLESVREMGADTIVEFFPWAYIEYAEGVYDWSQTDLILRHTENQGLRVIARMGLVPEWARPDPDMQMTTFNYLPDESFDEFADFVGVFAARYAGIINDLIIWNEPNLAFEWGFRPVDPALYVRMLRMVSERVRQANPNAQILAGALAPTIEPIGSVHGLNDVIYLEAMYALGAADYFDALAVHTYGFTDAPESPPGHEVLNFRRVELLREVMIQNGDPETPIYITESGWNDHPRWTKAVRPSRRIAYTIDGFEWAEQHWPWAEKVCLWVLRYPRPTSSYPDNFTLITPEFQYKPIYYAIQSYARGWDFTREGLWQDPPSD